MRQSILLALKDAGCSATLKRMLQRQGLQVLLAAQADKALRLAQSARPAVIVVDPATAGDDLGAGLQRSSPGSVCLVALDRTQFRRAVNGAACNGVPRPALKTDDGLALAAAIHDALAYRQLLEQKRALQEQLDRAEQELRRSELAIAQNTAVHAGPYHGLCKYDSVTRLPSRLCFLERLAAAMEQACGSASGVAVLVLGINRFELVTQTYGHLVGNRILQEIAERLLCRVGSLGSLGRSGGDRFAVMFCDDAGDAESIRERVGDLGACLREPVSIDGREVYLTISAGISRYPADDVSAEALLKHAETAMYFARQQPGNPCVFFTDEIATQVVRAVSLESDLRQAIERSEFVLHYQPQYDVAQRRLLGCEALLRWRHPAMGVLGPSEFMPHIERIGADQAVESWVLQQAIEQIASWAGSGVQVQTLGVNCSLNFLLGEGCVERLQRMLAAVAIDPSRIVLEFGMDRPLQAGERERLIGVLDQVRALGLRIALDNAGVGYWSIAQLAALPVDIVKIDRMLIEAIDQASEQAGIVKALIAAARKLGKQVIAAGVERPAQADVLRRSGCDALQGYLFGRPCAAQEIASALCAP